MTSTLDRMTLVKPLDGFDKEREDSGAHSSIRHSYRDEVKEVNEAIRSVARKLAASEEDIRLAEMRRYAPDLSKLVSLVYQMGDERKVNIPSCSNAYAPGESLNTPGTGISPPHFY